MQWEGEKNTWKDSYCQVPAKMRSADGIAHIARSIALTACIL